MESFSDGVIAVAITLLILNISVPKGGNLEDDLSDMWPQYAAYVTSFLTIGIIWINHHAMINRLREVNHAILFLNLLLLMSIVLLPFATNLMAVYLQNPHGQHLAAGVYGGALLLMGVSFASLNAYTLGRHPHMLSESLTPGLRRRLMVRSIGGITPYVLATAVAPVSAVATLVICGAVAVFYALPIASSAN
jgi:uncharacterized membrane protein